MSANAELLDIAWLMLCAALVMVMQAGFCLLETGFSRAKHSINVAIKNLLDFCIAGPAYWAIGFGLMFGASAFGIVGTSRFASSSDAGAWLLAFLLFQLVFCGTSTTIISGAVAERIRFGGYLMISLLVSAVFYPIIGHWAWGGALEQQPTGWLARRGFVDFAGSTVVHSLGGWLSLAAVLVVGPRLGRFSADHRVTSGRLCPKKVSGTLQRSDSKRLSRLLRVPDTFFRQSPSGHNIAVATVGAMLLWFGWFGFNGGSTLHVDGRIPGILLNTNLAAAAGALSALGLTWGFERLPNVAAAINGALGGLVGITASCHVVAPWQALLIGAIAGGVMVAGTRLLERWRVDDVVGAVPVHGFCGVWGTLAVGLFGDPARLQTGLSRTRQLLVQVQGVGACFAWAFGGGLLALWLLNRVFRLRVSAAGELQGLNVSEHGVSTELIDLLGVMEVQRHRGDFSQQAPVEPHTEVGQIAAEYNRVLKRVNTEILSREQTAAALRAAEEKYRSIFENSVEGIFQTTPDGRYLNANPALARIYGYTSPAELMGSIGNIERQLYVDPGRREQFAREIAERGVVTEFESEVYRRDGSVIWISENARVVRDEFDRIVRYEGTVLDISARKRSEQMQREKEAAQAASAAKSVFLARMSHEIRTPLHGVTGMLELLSATEMTGAQRRYARVARASADVLLSLINDILDFSKIEAGKLELARFEFNLHALLEDVADMFGHRAASKGLELACQIAADVPRVVHGDPDRLRQVLINLLNNAVKFTECGSVILNASLVGERLKLAVRDTGIGIPPEDIPRLFSPFTQVDATTTRRFGGSGLGLAICRQIVALMGGEIGVDSRPGTGSTFYFSIHCEPGCGERGPRFEELSRRLKGLRVLIVDDHVASRETLREQLVSWKVEADGVDGTVALDRLQRACQKGRPYQIVLLDDRARSDGLSRLADTLRDEFPGMSLLCLSSDPESVLAGEAALGSIAACLERPVRPSALFDALIGAILPANAGTPIALPARAVKSVRPDDGIQLLVVEDNDVNQLVAAELLRSAGYACDVAVNGREALAILERRRYDLVLMDCEMPEMDGYAATREIRRREAAGSLPVQGPRPLPIVALTANATRGDVERCLDAGMQACVTKPFAAGVLLETIARILKPAGPVAGVAPEDDLDSQEDTWVEDAVSGEPACLRETVDENAPFNLADLRNRCRCDEQFMKLVLRKFRQSAANEVRGLIAALEADDLETARRQAHALKGSSALVAAVPISRLAAEIESAAQAGDGRHAALSLRDLERAIDECFRQIDELLQEHR